MNADSLTQALSAGELLSPRIRRLVEIVGVTAAVQIVRARQGRRFFVPKKLEADTWLARLIGLEAAARLVAEFPGEVLEVDKASAALRELRNAAMRRDYAAGVTGWKLAEREDLTLRQVWTILGSGGTLGDKQLDMLG